MRSSDVLDALPAAWRARLAGNKIVPVTSGMSGAHVFRIGDGPSGDRYLKIATGMAADHLRGEVERTQWLASAGIRVPQIVMRFEDAGLFAVAMTALGGRSADHIEPDDWQPVVGSIARTLSALHSLPVDGCPFDETLPVRLARAREHVRQGTIDAAEFHVRNAGVTPRQLYARLVAEAPALEDCVVTHGDASLSNVILDLNGNCGFIDCGNAGKADRYVDFSPLVEGLEDRFGAQARSLFLHAYGGFQWDERKSEFYGDLYELF